MARPTVHPLFAGRGANDHVEGYTDERELLTFFENRARYVEQSRRTEAGFPAKLPAISEVPDQVHRLRPNRSGL